MSGKKSKQARKNDGAFKPSCPTRVERIRIWGRGFVSGQQVVSDLQAVAKRKSRSNACGPVPDTAAVMAALAPRPYEAELNDDTQQLLESCAKDCDTTVAGILGELEVNNMFPSGISKKEWLETCYAGTWIHERNAVEGLTRVRLSKDETEQQIQDWYDAAASISPLTTTRLANNRIVVSSILPNNFAGRMELRKYVRTGEMGHFWIQ